MSTNNSKSNMGSGKPRAGSQIGEIAKQAIMRSANKAYKLLQFSKTKQIDKKYLSDEKADKGRPLDLSHSPMSLCDRVTKGSSG